MESRLEEQQQPAPEIGVKLVIGVFFAVLGVLLTLDNLELVDSYRFLAWWPGLFIVIGIVKAAEGSGKVWSAVLILMGIWMIALNTGAVSITFFDLWPLILIAIGGMLVARAVGFRPELIAGNRIPATAGILSNRHIHETSQDFRGGRYAAFLGSCIIDLTEADIRENPAEIVVLAVMGGIEIYVPDRWEVIGEVVPVMAGFEIKVRPASGADRRLVVRGTVVMGGVEVKSRRNG